MLRIEVGPDDLAASRFAIAPLTELGQLMNKLDRGGSYAGVMMARSRWGERAAEVRHSLPWRALRALRPVGWGPDFIAPPPSGMANTVVDDLAAVRATSPSLAHAQIRRALALTQVDDEDVIKFLSGRGVVARLADALEGFWDRLVAPDWPQLLAISERDVLHRADQLARSGWAAALAGMHPSLSWTDGAVTIRRRPALEARLDGRGLLFVPSVFLYPKLSTYLEPPWQPTIVYPARGSGALWAARVTTSNALQRLLGAARAELLLHLDTPASTTHLVHATGYSLGTVGDHLKVLRDAGFVERGRAGRSVIYHRTPIGDAVVAGVE